MPGGALRPDDDGSWVVRGRLDPEVGALLDKALEMAGEVLYRKERRKLRSAETEGGPEGPQAEGLEGEEVTAAQRRADAVGLLAESVLQNGLVPGAGVRADESEQEEGEQKEKEEECDVAAGSKPARPIGRADRFQVVVHVDAEALREDGEGGEAFLEDGLRLSAETSRRLACDAGRVVMTHDEDGGVLNVGRRSRTDGRILPESPPLPPLEGDPMAELREVDDAQAIEIDKWTVTPDWNGEPFDFDIALGYFLFEGPEDTEGDDKDRTGDGSGDKRTPNGGGSVHDGEDVDDSDSVDPGHGAGDGDGDDRNDGFVSR